MGVLLCCATLRNHSSNPAVQPAIDQHCATRRWASFTLSCKVGRACLSNNAAERGLRGIVLGRKPLLFCGSDRGGRRAAAMYSLIATALCALGITAKINGVDPQVAYGCPRPDRRASCASAGRAGCPGIGRQHQGFRLSGMTTHINKVDHLATITKVARDLGE